jgi:hypothetical protein
MEGHLGHRGALPGDYSVTLIGLVGVEWFASLARVAESSMFNPVVITHLWLNMVGWSRRVDNQASWRRTRFVIPELATQM